MCLNAGCEASYLTSELLEQHIGVHALSDTSRFAQHNVAVDIACNGNPAVSTLSDTYDPRFPSVASASEGYAGASPAYLEPLHPVGDLPVVHACNNNTYAPRSLIDTTAYGPAVAGLPSTYVAESFNWSDPLDLGEDSFLPSGPDDFSKGSNDLTRPRLPEFSNKAIPAADWHYPVPSRYVQDPFGTNATYTGNNISLTDPSIHTNEHAGAMSPLPIPIPISNTALIPLDTEPPTPPTCTVCNQTFTRHSDLKRHAHIHQTGSKVFKCQVEGCTYGSYRKDKLGEHTKCRHSAKGKA